ncbi:transposase [Anaerosalibacter sp. Marseille-P3206]|uniref:transposase n=1 Tax=Anaerosalibacter sp. Marseille-P3206 TaxID=1871005 RepID=UPI000984EDB6|nr:transposase [Anaerosalibacter sp. Marseille-P3206]
MPRCAREKSGSGIYHIIMRGINKQNIFEDNEDKMRFLDTLDRYKTVCNYQIYAYCLMNNHIHLLLKEDTESISYAIKRISGSYVHWYNNKYERCGHLFQERFKSEPVDTEDYFLIALRYIHQNPVKAKISKDLTDYYWSSYGEYVGRPKIVDVDFPLELFSTDRKNAIDLFIKYMKENNNDECLDYIELIRLTDSEVKNRFLELGISNMSELQQLEKSKRNEILVKIKSVEGVSIRQLSRITGISKSVIGKI